MVTTNQLFSISVYFLTYFLLAAAGDPSIAFCLNQNIVFFHMWYCSWESALRADSFF